MTASRSRAGGWRADVASGLTVALVGLPQCLAYAMMSGVPPAYGLVTAAVAGFVAPLVGRSPHIITGPTNTTGLLILAAMTPWLGANGLVGASGLGVLATLTLLAGLVRVLATYVRADKLLRFFPESVLAGFTAGAGTLIGVNQLDEAIGLAPLGGGNLYDELSGIVGAFVSGHHPAWLAVGVSVATAAAIFLGKRLRPRWPVALASVVVATVVAFVMGLDASAGLPVVSDRAVVPSGWPPMALPVLSLDVVRQLALPAAAIALLGTLELTVSVKASGEATDMQREIRAQGVANVAGAFAGAFPASASLTRSALLRLGGASTRRAALIAALTVVPILFFGADFVSAIPQASLAGVLLVTATGMIVRTPLQRLWNTAPEPRLLLVTTFLATLVLPLEWAILGGAGL
ncbi:MAG: SulP family inorganic anion transporter, partial [Myxococcales bacterium]|nr:SulP family inorganic anion transporter [Myxococcales bacterium]